MKRQQNAFAETPDLPLFSGTPVPAKLEVFSPREEAQQDSFFDRREYIAVKPKPTLTRRTLPSDGWMDGGEPYTDEEMEIIRAEEGEEEEE